MGKDVVVILGHPDAESYCAALAQGYVTAASEVGHQVSLYALGNMEFDPILRQGYKVVQQLEPDLLELQAAIARADHLVFVYPTWWGTMPALLKGMFDRLFIPGFAFKYRQPESALWDKLLKGRSAQVIVTMDTPGWYYRLVYKLAGHHIIKRCILDFCGIKPVAIHAIGPVKSSSLTLRQKWLAEVQRLAANI
ncbi:MAG: NAD(P)H-dependent oxidoreductase [Aeromonadaceae bacterium]